MSTFEKAKRLKMWRMYTFEKNKRDTPKNFSIPEVETRCPVTLDASTFAETSV